MCELGSVIFRRYQRSEEVYVLVLMEMVVQGISTRKVSAITARVKSKLGFLHVGLDFQNADADGDGFDRLVQ